MDRVQYEYLRINKYLMYTIGQWPHQSVVEKTLVSVVFVPIITAQLVLQGGGMVAALNDSDIDSFMEGIAPFIISWMCICKFVNYVYNHDKMKNLLNTMQEDWKTYSRVKPEYEILCRSYAVGKRVTLSYATSLYGSMTPFMAVPALLSAADAIGFYNASGERPLMFRVEHFVDAEKYYYAVLIHSYFGTLGYITIVVAIDSMMVLYVQHECGICEILGRRLEAFMQDDSLEIDLHAERQTDVSYQNAKNCVLLHKHIIEFAKSLEDANTTSFLFQLGFNMVGISFTGFQAVLKMENPNESLRYASFTICLTSVLLLESWPGQQLSDYTDSIFEYTTSGKWYRASISTRKLIHIMLMRSVVPIRLTAGKMYILNLENFSSVVRTSFSYFTVLCSMQ